MNALVSGLAARNAERITGMMVRAEVPHGTRWWALVGVGAGLASLLYLYQLVAAGALAVNFTTADQQFSVYSNYVEGISSAGMLSTSTKQTAANDSGVADIGIKQAKLVGFCGVANQNVPVVGSMALMITAGVPVKAAFDHAHADLTDGTGAAITVDSSGKLTGASAAGAVVIDDLFFNSDSLSGYGNQITGLELGRSADEVVADANVNGGQWPAGQAAPVAGGFGLTAEQLNIAGFDGGSYGLDLHGQVTLPRLKITTILDTHSQADCPTEAHS